MIMSKIVNYNNSPLVEVVIGIQLNESKISNVFLFDVFYNHFKKSFPIIEEQPYLNSILESKDGEVLNANLNQFSTRKFFLGQDQNKLIQIQNNRILFNWRAINTNIEYPNYDNVISDFLEIFNFIDSNLDIKSAINQFEFTYVDHISLNNLNKNSLKFSDLINIINVDKEIGAINANFNFWENEIGGNLIVSIKSARKVPNTEKIFILETSCRGFKEFTEIKMWYDKAHEILINYFETITTSKAKELWQKQL